MIRRAPLHREQLAVLAVLALLTAAAWGLTLTPMQFMATMGGASSSVDHGAMAGQLGMGGMQETSGNPEIGVQLILFLGMWVTMMAAMMLPSAAPMILLFSTVSRRKRERGGSFVPTWIFVAGYLAVWTAFGAYAFGMNFVGADLARGNPMLGQLGPRVAAVAMLAAGLYQLTPLKQRCLSHCRSPLGFIMEHWRPGTVGALRMGIQHGVYCVGCCWVLFILLVVVGLASVAWMGLVTLIILAEKLLPRGRLVTLTVAFALLGLGLLTLARPELLTPAMG
jgi:predicted metal-binding membrane protein